MTINQTTYKDLQLDLEKYYFKKINPIVKKLEERYKFVESYRLKKDKQFYSLINRALNVDGHYSVKYLVNRVLKKLGIKVNIKVYLYQSTVFNIKCLPNHDSNRKEICLFVSQHFFNNLNEDEQTGIIGHEIAHFLFGHLDIPIHEILEHSFDLDEINGLKNDLLSWSKACELSADLVGLVANDYNFKAYSTAIIKNHTGLSDSSNSNFNISPLVDLAMEQYERFAENPLYSGETSTHPLTALRVKVVNSITKTKLFKNIGDKLQEETLLNDSIEFNEIINGHIKEIYPEMIPDMKYALEILPPLVFAVAYADGVIDKNEIRTIKSMLGNIDGIEKYEEYLTRPFLSSNFEDVVDKLVLEGIELTRKSNFSKHEIVPIIRNLLIIAASDGEIEKEELQVIYKYATAFDFSRQEIIIILQTHNQINF